MTKLILSALSLLFLAAGFARADAPKSQVSVLTGQEGVADCPWGSGLYCGGNGIPGDPRYLYNCDGGRTTLVERCGHGCTVQPHYVDDYCGTAYYGGDSTFNGGGTCGDYPADWCAAPENSKISFGGHTFLNRECTAYAAFERWKHGQPFATGNAGDWPGSSQEPTVGSVAIWDAGTVSRYGHVAYVTAVSDGAITISEFNWRPFQYDSRTIKRNTGAWPSRFWN